MIDCDNYKAAFRLKELDIKSPVVIDLAELVPRWNERELTKQLQLK